MHTRQWSFWPRRLYGTNNRQISFKFGIEVWEKTILRWWTFFVLNGITVGGRPPRDSALDLLIFSPILLRQVIGYAAYVRVLCSFRTNVATIFRSISTIFVKFLHGSFHKYFSRYIIYKLIKENVNFCPLAIFLIFCSVKFRLFSHLYNNIRWHSYVCFTKSLSALKNHMKGNLSSEWSFYCEFLSRRLMLTGLVDAKLKDLCYAMLFKWARAMMTELAFAKLFKWERTMMSEVVDAKLKQLVMLYYLNEYG